MSGKLIVIEGLDGSGKSTQMQCLTQKLDAVGAAYKRIKLPNYSSPSCSLVNMYLNGEFGKKADDVNAYAASSFYAVDRFASFKQVWGEDYLNGSVILADRYATSNAVHQMVKLPEEQWDEYLSWLEDYEYVKMGIPKPTAVIFLDMPIEVSQKLMSERYNGDEKKKDVHEADIEYLKKCRKAAFYAADKLSWNVINCTEGERVKSIEEIADEIFEVVKKEIL